ncbi:MAG: endonuclease domain-containing protein [Candidatus Zixiibacteriota bacterium]
MRTQVPGYVYDLCRKLRQKQTDAETLLWECLRGKRLNGVKFRRQHPIGRYVADFYCPEAQLAIELDGKVHDVRDQKEYDRVRKEMIETGGIRVVRFKNEEIEQNIEAVLKKVLSLTSPP